MKTSWKIKRAGMVIMSVGVMVLLVGMVGLAWGLVRSEMRQADLLTQLRSSEGAYDELATDDQIQRNNDLEGQIKQIEDGYGEFVSVYDKLVGLRDRGGDVSRAEELLSAALSKLAEANYEEAIGGLSEVSKELTKADAALIAAQQAALAKSIGAVEITSAPVNNTPPGSGYSRQVVSSDAGNFAVSLVAADLSSTRVIVDTASGGTCTNDCPVLPLADYVARNGAYAGINGSYFCPADYASCAGKTNSFDLLLMNKDKVYFNSDNNVYSNNPGVVFGGSYIRFLGAVSGWGRDTGIDSMISNYPLLVSGGNVVFGGDDDPKKGSKGNRSFVANQGNRVFIGVVHSATVAESARVLKAMGMENGLNLDDGGSTALWSGGYKVGPGRNLPNVILFVGK